MNARFIRRQRVKLFEIIKKIDNLTYYLKLFFLMKIYLVMSVIQFELKSSSQDLYNRFTSNEFSLIIEKDDDDTKKSYIIERLLERRTSREKIQYLIKWFDYDFVHNVWYDVDDLTDAQDFIKNFEKKIDRRFNLSRRARKQSSRKAKNNHRNEH